MSQPMDSEDWSFLQLADLASDAGADKLHLRVGVPPLMRGSDRELVPVDEQLAELTEARLMRELSVLVEPELWPEFEQIGEGECQVMGGPRGFVRLTLFRNAGSWSVVAHL
ncbi:hypothetical protein KQI84_00300 [bacterium]|nr:hypothetical protein [bacterium]